MDILELIKLIIILLLLPLLAYCIIKCKLSIILYTIIIVFIIIFIIIIALLFKEYFSIFLFVVVVVVYFIICLLVGCNESNNKIKEICMKIFNFKELNLLFLLVILWCLLAIPIISSIDGGAIKTISQLIAIWDDQTMLFIQNTTGYDNDNNNIEITIIKNVGAFITIILSLTTLYMFNLINNTLSKYSLGVINLILKKNEKIWGLLYFAFNILLIEVLLMLFPSITIFIIVNLIIIAILIWQIRSIDEYIKLKYYMDTLVNDIADRLKKQAKENRKNHISYMKKYYCNISLNDIPIFNIFYKNNNGDYKDINSYEFVLNDAFISLRDLIRKAVDEKDDTLLTLCGVVIHKIVKKIGNNSEITEDDNTKNILFKIICNIIILDILIPSYDNKWIYGIRIAWDLLNLNEIRAEFKEIIGNDRNKNNINKIKEVIKKYKEKVGLKFDGESNGSKDD